MAERVHHLATVGDTYIVQEPVEAFRRRARVAGEKPPLQLAREEREHGGRKRNAAKRLRCFPTDNDIAARWALRSSAFFHFAVDLERFRQSHAGSCEHAE